MRTPSPTEPRRRALTLALAGVVLSALNARAADDPPAGGHPYAPAVAKASPDAEKALKSFRTPAGLKTELFAAEPLLANPVAFTFDEKGRVFVVETYRLHHGVTDTRGHMNWLDDDLASRTIADRVAKYRKFLGEKGAADYGVEHDRLKLVEDRDGDGKADHAEVFADGFKNIPDGIAAGVLARNGDVYFTCIPDLWLLRDTNRDGKADVKKSLHYGYGVHTGFLGHDLHGLTFGPDGKLYFSIGDRGTNVKSAVDDKTVFLPDTGAVFRCDADGKNLEVFATGLRNPQELAFDEHGNLFTVDNNSDSGDRARIVYIMEGSSAGWTMGWQYLESPVSRGPWNGEKLWYPKFEGQAADIVPPVANFSDGPSGFAYNPGSTRIPARFARHFFLADFRGSAGQSGVRAFSVKPDGAGFALDRQEQFLWGLEATDVDFGPDGAVYVSDWVEGWDTTGKGRIYKVTDPSVNPAAADDVKAQLARGFSARPVAELVGLLAHPDQRVRREAQFALAADGDEAVGPLQSALNGSERLPRLHAVWALGQIARKDPKAVAPLVPLLKDKDDEVVAQAAKTLGDLRHSGAAGPLIETLKSRSPRVKSLAAIALGRLAAPEAIPALLDALRANTDSDPFLRHALVMGLAGSGDDAALVKAAKDRSAAARMGVLLALRRHKSPEIARFLDDADPRLVTEAARAIYDAPIDAALPKLAALAGPDHANLSEPARRRAFNAAARVGRPDDAKALVAGAADSKAKDSLRVEALGLLADWPKPPGRDRVTGLWRPRDAHAASDAAKALEPNFAALLDGKSNPVRTAAIRAAAPLGMTAVGNTLFSVVTDANRREADRVEALKALESLKDRRLGEAVKAAVAAPQSSLRVEGRRLLVALEPSTAVPMLASVLETGSVADQQGAFAALGAMPEGTSDALLAKWLTRLESSGGKKIAPEIELDLLDAARKRKSGPAFERVKALDTDRPTDDPPTAYRGLLAGGSALRGSKIVAEKAEVQCLRCHKVAGRGGEVGPDLAGVAKRGDRKYLLESVILPNKQIAKGFETTVVGTADGQVHTGILKEETADSLRLMNADGKLETIPKADVEERRRGASAMPEDLIKNLTRAEIRDVVEYLSTLK